MERFGGFELVRELGRGSSATLFLARDPSNQEELSLKIFHPIFAQDPQFARRIEREFKLLTQLKHPNIIALRGMVSNESSPALVIDYVDGGNLEKFQSKLPYALPEVSVLIVIEILKALEYAHAQNVIHRDLKPENVLISKDGKVSVTDFGLAKLQESQTMITHSHSVLGSADYMSPEQAAGDFLTPSSDLFAVASILYFLTTGTRPFSRPSALATLRAIQDGVVEAPERRNPKLSGPLSRLIQKGLSKEPAQRFASATEFRTALENYLNSIGLLEVWFSFTHWNADPSAITLEALRVSASVITENAQRAILKGNRSEGLEWLSQLSLKAPESPAIERLSQSVQQSRNRRKIGVLILFLFLFLSGLGIYSYRLGSPKNRGEVRFSVGSNTQIYWDGALIDSKAPIKGIQAGPHAVKFVRKGFPPIESEIIVKENEPTLINVP